MVNAPTVSPHGRSRHFEDNTTRPFVGRFRTYAEVDQSQIRVLYRAFLEAGLPTPKFRIEVPVGGDPNVARWFYDLVCTLASRLEKDELAASGIGHLETLESRLETERIAARSFAASVALVSAWSQKPG
jgi:hypothetical protein